MRCRELLLCALLLVAAASCAAPVRIPGARPAGVPSIPSGSPVRYVPLVPGLPPNVNVPGSPVRYETLPGGGVPGAGVTPGQGGASPPAGAAFPNPGLSPAGASPAAVEGAPAAPVVPEGSTWPSAMQRLSAEKGEPQRIRVNSRGWVVWQDGPVPRAKGFGTELLPSTIDDKLPGKPPEATEIILSDGVQTLRVTNNDSPDYDPAISDAGWIVWTGPGATPTSVLVWDLATPVLSVAECRAFPKPAVVNSGVVWFACNGHTAVWCPGWEATGARPGYDYWDHSGMSGGGDTTRFGVVVLPPGYSEDHWEYACSPEGWVVWANTVAYQKGLRVWSPATGKLLRLPAAPLPRWEDGSLDVNDSGFVVISPRPTQTGHIMIADGSSGTPTDSFDCPGGFRCSAEDKQAPPVQAQVYRVTDEALTPKGPADINNACQVTWASLGSDKTEWTIWLYAPGQPGAVAVGTALGRDYPSPRVTETGYVVWLSALPASGAEVTPEKASPAPPRWGPARMPLPSPRGLFCWDGGRIHALAGSTTEVEVRGMWIAFVANGQVWRTYCAEQ